MMITREEIRELAAFQADESKGASALSFYFQPDPPQDRSHRSEGIVAKDVVKQALQSAGAQGKNGSVHADLDRVIKLATNLRGQTRGKAVFACSAQNFWKEYDLPPRLGATHIYLQPRFQLKPLAALLGGLPTLCVAVIDKQRGRVFDLRLDDFRESPSVFNRISHSATSHGDNGHEAGHAERRVAEEVLQHYKAVSDRLLADFEKGIWERLIIGCHEVNWPDFEAHMHPYLKQRLIGRFAADIPNISNEEIRDRANSVLEKWTLERASSTANEAIDFAKANGRGVTGLRRVLEALEVGEVQSLIFGENYSARAVECPHCDHLNAHLVAKCVACGHATRELTDVCDAIIPMAIRQDIELFTLKDHEDLDRAGNIAALLRFRADQSRTGRMVAAS